MAVFYRLSKIASVTTVTASRCVQQTSAGSTAAAGIVVAARSDDACKCSMRRSTRVEGFEFSESRMQARIDGTLFLGFRVAQDLITLD